MSNNASFDETRAFTRAHARRALIVADEMGLSLQQSLMASGYVTRTSTIADAPRTIRDFVPDVMIMIVSPRQTDGEAENEAVALARRLRAETSTYSLPLIFMWGEDESSLRTAAQNIGTDDYFSLSTPTSEMFARLDALFWRVESGRRSVPAVADRRLEIDNFIFILDAVREDARAGLTGSLALVYAISMRGKGEPLDKAVRDATLVKAHGFLKLNLRRMDAVTYYGPTALLVYLQRMETRAATGALSRLHREFIQEYDDRNIIIGLASFPADGNDVEGLIGKAEVAVGIARSDSTTKHVIPYEMAAKAAALASSTLAEEEEPEAPEVEELETQDASSSPDDETSPGPEWTEPADQAVEDLEPEGESVHEIVSESPDTESESSETESSETEGLELESPEPASPELEEPEPESESESILEIIPEGLEPESEEVSEMILEGPESESEEVSEEVTGGLEAAGSEPESPEPASQEAESESALETVPENPEAESLEEAIPEPASPEPAGPEAAEALEPESAEPANESVPETEPEIAEPASPEPEPEPASAESAGPDFESPEPVTPETEGESVPEEVTVAPPAKRREAKAKEAKTKEAAQPPARTTVLTAEEAAARELERRTSGALMPRRLLLAVSDPVRMTQLNSLIRAAGYEARAAFDGQQALHLLRIERPDLLLLDYELKGIDGVETMRRLRKQSGGRLPLSIVMVISGDNEQAGHEALKLGAHSVHLIPYDPAELLDSIREAGNTE